jgi:hypothetical protein
MEKIHIHKQLQSQKYLMFLALKKQAKQRQKITGLEKATFGGQTGITQGALSTR